MEGEPPQLGTVNAETASAKKELRRCIRRRLAVMDVGEQAAMSLSICRQLAVLVQAGGFWRVAVFAARPGEVDLLPLMEMMPEREWFFPVVHEGRRLSFHHVRCLDEMAPGCMGIREPGPDCREMEAGALDLIVLPGAAFTPDGRRMGYGGGFYDTLLAGPAKGLPLVGVCFPCQLIDDVPTEPHDRRVDRVVTPQALP